jgi:glycosyltransferase involved in cell wall biosynthesis
MACGVPVIARGRGSVPEVVKHGETGFIVDTIDEAVSALGLVEQLNAEAIRRYVAQNFSREHMVDEYIRVYKEVTAHA